MSDPFRLAAIRGRIVAAGALVFVAVLIVAVSYLDFGMPITDGHPVQAQVLRVGTHSTGGVGGGDLPILTVRLPNGSVRDVPTTWADIDRCVAGRSISLLRQGNAVQVGRPGCVRPH